MFLLRVNFIVFFIFGVPFHVDSERSIKAPFDGGFQEPKQLFAVDNKGTHEYLIANNLADVSIPRWSKSQM